MMKKSTIILVFALGLSLVSGTSCTEWFIGGEETTPTSTPTSQITPTELQVHFIDVGQGDSILIDLSEIEILIDGGDRSPSVVSYLSNYVDGDLEVVVATHPHADHIGGLIEVLEEFTVLEIWVNGDPATSQTYSDFMDLVNAEGADVTEARRGDTISVGGLELDVIHPVDPLFGNTNDNSIVLGLGYGDIDFLFTGDAEEGAEASMIAAGVLTDIDILKVGHHGSRTASSQAFLDIVQPEVAIYMAGTGNTYGHPHEETITKLKTMGVEIYGTAINGTIVVTTAGVSYSVVTEK